MSINWKAAMKEARAKAEASTDPEKVAAWHNVAGYIAEAAELETPGCPCGQSLKTPRYCPWFGDHKG